MAAIFEANGAKFYSADDMIISWILKTKQEFEPDTTRFIFDHATELFLDVGASTGWFSIPIAKLGVEVVAVEPNERVIKRLLLNCELNNIDSRFISIFKGAASDHEGTATFNYNPLVPLTSGGSIEHVPCSAPRKETVPVVTLDSMVPGERQVSLIKIDVEGHEVKVLAGAKHIIEQDRPALVLEANTAMDRTKISEWLDQHDYEYNFVDSRNFIAVAK